MIRSFLRHDSSHRGRRTHAGFTVIEVVLGLGIFAVMGMSVIMIYTNAVRIDGESRRLSDLSMESYWTLAALEEDFQNSAAYRYDTQGQDEIQPVFDGEENSIRMLVEGPQSLQWVSYRLVTPEEGSVHKTVLGQRLSSNTDQVLSERSTAEGTLQILTRLTADFKGRPLVEKDPVASEILTKRIAGFKFLYAVKTDGGLSWKEEWHKPEPPAAVRVMLKLGDGSSRDVLEFSRDILVSSAGQE